MENMAWRENVDIKEVLNFCKENWKSREELREHFKLDNVESWHMCKYLSKLYTNMECKKKGKMYVYRTRVHATFLQPNVVLPKELE